MMKTRIEHDLLGDREVPADAYWGVHTLRAVENFPISGQPMPREFIRALALVKAAAAQVNARLRARPGRAPLAVHRGRSRVGRALVTAEHILRSRRHQPRAANFCTARNACD